MNIGQFLGKALVFTGSILSDTITSTVTTTISESKRPDRFPASRKAVKDYKAYKISKLPVEPKSNHTLISHTKKS